MANLQAAYLQALRAMHAAAMPVLLPWVQSAFLPDNPRERADASVPRPTIKAVKAALREVQPRLRESVARSVVAVDRANRRALAQIPGIDPTRIVGGEKIVRGFRDRAVGLIKTLESKYLGELSDLLESSDTSRMHVSAMTRRMQERFEVTESRARFWARDQTLKLNAEITRTRMTNAGVRRYEWITSKDDRVRGNPQGLYPNAEIDHWARDGKVYSFDDAPEGGHPGEDYNCRCTQYPILDDESRHPEG